MNATVPESPQVFEGYEVNFYTQRLRSFDVDYLLSSLIKFCLAGDWPSELLAAYLGAVQSFERIRRDAIENGAEILEAQLPAVPAHHWSGQELGRALQKAIGMLGATHGELHEMIRHILNCLMAETQDRLEHQNAVS